MNESMNAFISDSRSTIKEIKDRQRGQYMQTDDKSMLKIK